MNDSERLEKIERHLSTILALLWGIFIETIIIAVFLLWYLP